MILVSKDVQTDALVNTKYYVPPKNNNKIQELLKISLLEKVNKIDLYRPAYNYGCLQKQLIGMRSSIPFYEWIDNFKLIYNGATFLELNNVCLFMLQRLYASETDKLSVSKAHELGCFSKAKIPDECQNMINKLLFSDGLYLWMALDMFSLEIETTDERINDTIKQIRLVKNILEENLIKDVIGIIVQYIGIDVINNKIVDECFIDDIQPIIKSYEHNFSNIHPKMLCYLDSLDYCNCDIKLPIRCESRLLQYHCKSYDVSQSNNIDITHFSNNPLMQIIFYISTKDFREPIDAIESSILQGNGVDIQDNIPFKTSKIDKLTHNITYNNGNKNIHTITYCNPLQYQEIFEINKCPNSSRFDMINLRIYIKQNIECSKLKLHVCTVNIRNMRYSDGMCGFVFL